MNRKQYSLIVTLALIAGLVGGVVSSQFFVGQPVFAEKKREPTKEETLRLEKCRTYRQALAEHGKEGRFQAVRMDDTNLMIFDTKEGYLWLFGGGADEIGLVYMGQVCPGLKIGEVIHRLQSKEEK